MRLVAVTRVLNEDDIVEAFVRHHAAIFDHHLFLDNGSIDRTLEILAALRIEGLPLTVLHNTAAFFAEEIFNTKLFQHARSTLAADWVVFLDADEFLDARERPGGLRARLASLPLDMRALKIPTIDYVGRRDDDPNELCVPARMRWRLRTAPAFISHVAVRAQDAPPDLRIATGAHGVFLDGAELPSELEHSVRLAHYSLRSPWQAAAKNIVGRLKVIAAGAETQSSGMSNHYISLYEALRDRTADALADPEFLRPSGAGLDLVRDPIEYFGGPLALTRASDQAAKAIRALIGYGELLAVQFGQLADNNAAIRLQLSHDAAALKLLF